jgi:hypothetical protein
LDKQRFYLAVAAVCGLRCDHPGGEDHCEAVLPGEELLLLAFAAEYRPTSLLKQRVELADVGVT